MGKIFQYTRYPISQEAKAMSFGQLIGNNMRNIFLEKSYTNCGQKLFPKPFFKKSKLSMWINCLKF